MLICVKNEINTSLEYLVAMPPKYFRKKTVKADTEYKHTKSDAIYLIIVESPSKCAKIEGFLGSDYKCIASKGHIRYIDGIKNIDAKKQFAIKFSVVDEKREHVAFMKSCIADFRPENIILASDDDREGEAIAWHICDHFGLPIHTTKRIVFHEITKPAVVKAVRNPGVINMNLVLAQHARQVLDMIVGFKVSPFLWKYIHNNKTNGLSAGRCQTPALRLVYDNDKEVNTGSVETKYKTTGTFFTKNIPFSLHHDFSLSSEVEDFLEKSVHFKHTLSLGDPKDSIRKPPKPFNTSNLLQTASNILHMSPKETMSHCQTLYQAGHITYMRTENTKYSADFLPKVRSYILETWKTEEYLGDFSAIVNNDETNPHEAIRVTHIENSFVTGLEARAQSLYRLIWKTTVESCMAPANYKCTKASISAPDDHEYVNVIEVPVFLGWKVVSEQVVDTTSEQNTGAGLLLFFKSLKSGSAIDYTKIESVVTVTHRHSHYTESSLIKKLEDLGIGRPSTFAMIIDTIVERGYVKKTDIPGIAIQCDEFVLREDTIESRKIERVFGNEKNKLVIQPVGIAAVEFLTEHFSTLFDYDYTKTMEEDLDKISGGGGIQWHEICENCCDTIATLSKPLSKMAKPKYIIKSRDSDREYELVFHQYGASLKYTCGEDIVYKSINSAIKIDLEEVKAGKYMAEDLLEIKDDYLGKYEGEDMYIKTGKYGAYVQWGEHTASIKAIQKPLNEIVMTDVIALLSPVCDPNAPRKPPQNQNILRNLNADLSIRKGKFGPYIYYLPADAKKPEFFKLTKHKTTYLTCEANTLIEWISNEYLTKR
jgi:DNA topoisomerase-1